MRPKAYLLPLLVAWGLAQASPLAGQSIVAGALSGSVERADGGGEIGQVLVTLRSLDLGLARETWTDRYGDFAFRFVAAGPYELRLEGVGFRPLVAGPVTINAGDARRVRLSLVTEPPPVSAVDTVDLGLGFASTWQPGGFRLGAGRLADLPEPMGDIGATASTSTRWDQYLGAEGLPGEQSVVVIDGVPFFRVSPPRTRGSSLATTIFPRGALTSLDALSNPADVEWGGSAGGHVALSSRSGPAGGGTEASGSWSGDPLWSSSTLDFAAPALASFVGSLGTSIDLKPDTSRLFIAGEALRQESPLPPRLTGGNGGTENDALGSLTSPAVEQVTRASALARLDWWLGPNKRVLLRAAGGRMERTYTGFDAAPIGYGAAVPVTATDLSLMGGLTKESEQGFTLEFRGGVSASDRRFAMAPGILPPTTLASSGIPIAGAEATPADVSRLDLYASPVFHFPLASGTLKAGAAIRTSRHSVEQGLWEHGDYVLDGIGVPSMSATGLAVRASAATASSFATSEIGLFAQYDWDAAPGLLLTLGGRGDLEFIPKADSTISPSWFAASGLRKDQYPSSFKLLGGVARLLWDVNQDGRTTASMAASLTSGDMDPLLLHEILSRDGSVDVSRYAGSGIQWSEGSIPAGAGASPTLTLMGPDSRLPRSARFGAGLTRRVEGGWSFHLEGSARRTDFLPRRRDLNRAVVPLASDPNGRDVFGQLRQLGSLVVAEPGSYRRFTGFDDVWSIDTDGWSDYRAVTVGLERQRPNLDLLLSYTRSQTRDNWVGAAAGLPDAQVDPALPEGKTWSEGISDFDVPDRFVAVATLRPGGGTGLAISAIYRYESGLPFTPGYRVGVDANGDGSVRNDVAWVPNASEIASLLSEWPCLNDDLQGFATRNGCRGTARHGLDARIRARLARFGDRSLELVVDGYGLIDRLEGLRDHALLLVDPDGSITESSDGQTVTIPLTVNPDFGQVIIPSNRGRMLRIGLRLGGPR